MSALSELRAAGFVVAEEAGRLAVRPASRLTPELSGRIRKELSAILAELRWAPEDDRRTCRDCARLTRGGYCRAAAAGLLQHAGRKFEPDADRLHRCEAFREVTP